MQLRSRIWKKAVSLGLAVIMFAAAPVWQEPLHTYAAAVTESGNEKLQEVTLESVRREASESYAGSEKKGFDIAFDEPFAGEWKDYSADTADRHYMQVLENLRTGAEDQTVIIRFKTNQDGILFGMGRGLSNDGNSLILSIVNGRLRFVPFNTPNTGFNAADFKGSYGSDLADGNYHTLAISFLPSRGFEKRVNIHLVIDGKNDEFTIKGADYGTKWKAGFNQVSQAFDTFQIGGGIAGAVGGSSDADFNGNIDFITVINKAYNADELRKITCGDRDFTAVYDTMMTGLTSHTWLFTGGTEGVADFAVSRTTRNWVGLFEDNMRLDGSVAGGDAYILRGRCVFNTSRKGADLADILAEYDTRIAAYKTRAAGIMIGAADYGKGAAGLDEFTENLNALVQKLKEDDKFPIILTPYPSLNTQKQENVRIYAEKIVEKAAEWKITAIDLSSLSGENYLNSDDTLTPAGHQAVANAIKDSLLKGGYKTSFPFNQLSDGNYTIAKQTQSKDEARVQEVTAGESSITVRVDETSISGEEAQLEYTLTDTKGEEISGAVTPEEVQFTVDGLKRGETYILTVYDVSRGNVKESYHPVSIKVINGAKGTDLEYEDENASQSQKIQAYFTSEKPVTYLFMGDSITHGILTNGYDNVPQLFAKYLYEIGREEDVVLNTGVCDATLATTLDQLDGRLTNYKPDVVMIMLGTNDTSNTGEAEVLDVGKTSRHGITAEEFVNRYKQLLEKIYETNPDASVVLRVPCDMTGQLNAHEGYEEKFAKIYDVADAMREEKGMDISVVNHLEEWRNYRDNVRNDNIGNTGYGWLINDGVHPNGRGNLSMFQQIVKELGIYVNTSELANYQYALDDWSDTSEIEVPVMQRGSRAGVAMSDISGYTNNLKNVTLTLTADGKSISKTEEYAENGEITLSGLDPQKEYTAAVTGKDAVNSKIITFQTNLTVSTNTELTEKEAEEFTESLEEAKVSGETSLYPADVLAAYERMLREIELKYENTLTTENLDAALAEIKVAKENFAAALDTAKSEAVQKLADALSASEKTYQEQKSLYDTLPGWNAYQTAYQNAKAADEDTDTNTLRQLLKALSDAEQTIKAEKLKKEEEEKNNNSVGTQPVPEEKAEVGKVYTEGDYSYKILSLSQKTAEITGIADGRTLKKITVGNDVKIKDETYKIVSVGKSAFLGNKDATSAVIGKNVETIGAQAFAKCTKLKSVTINSKKLKEIGSKAFFNSKKINKIVIKSTALKKAGKNAFKGTAAKLKIKVPKAKLKKYKSILAKKGQGKKAVITK